MKFAKFYGIIFFGTTEGNGTEEVDLPDLVADQDGICSWNWTVPRDAIAGTAVFRAMAEQNGIHDSIMPYTFCIEKCPWDAP